MSAARAAGLLVLAVLAAYAASLAATFQFDDYNVIVDAPAVHSWGALLDDLGRGLRPVLKATYALSWMLGEGSALPFHAFNVGLHAVNACLVYFIGLQLAARWRLEAAGAVLAAALLFALHPVQTEAITYASGRSSSLMASFYLGALLVYLRRGPAWASLGLFALACGSKETALTLPLALLLSDACSRERTDWKSLVVRQWPYWALAAAALLAALSHERYGRFIDAAFAQRSILDNLLTQVQGVGYLISRLWLPHRLNIDPALPVLSSWDAALAVQAVLLLALVLLGTLSLKTRPWVGFGLGWFFLQLAPTNSLMPRLDVANERQLYLALWGLALALCLQIATLSRGSVPKLAATAVLATLALLTAYRQTDYWSEIALWEASIREAPWNARAYNNLGHARALSGDHAGAVHAFREALAFDPRDGRAGYNLERSLAALRGR